MTQSKEMPPDVSDRPTLTDLDYEAPFRKETTSALQIIVVLLATLIAFAMFGVLMYI